MSRLAIAATVSAMLRREVTGNPSPEAIKERATHRHRIGGIKKARQHYRDGDIRNNEESSPMQPAEVPAVESSSSPEPQQGTQEPATDFIEPVAAVNEPTLKISPLRGNTNSSDTGLVRGILVEPLTPP